MKRHLIIALTLIMAATLGTAVAQEAVAQEDSTRFRNITLFEGETIDKITLSGDFDLEILQGTPTSVRIELPEQIPTAPLTPEQERKLSILLTDPSHQPDREEEPRDTLRYALRKGRLLLVNTRPQPVRKLPAPIQLPARFRAKAVITVPDLQELSCISPGEIRFSGKTQLQNTKLIFFNRVQVIGADLSAEKALSLSVFNNARFEGRIADTPEVELKVFNTGEADIALSGIADATADLFNHGSLRLSGTVDRLTRHIFNHGTCDTAGLTASQTIDQKAGSQPQATDIAITVTTGAQFGIGRAERIATAIDGGITLRKAGPADTSVSAADRQHVILLEPGASILLRGGTYRVDTENGLTVLRKAR